MMSSIYLLTNRSNIVHRLLHRLFSLRRGRGIDAINIYIKTTNHGFVGSEQKVSLSTASLVHFLEFHTRCIFMLLKLSVKRIR